MIHFAMGDHNMVHVSWNDQSPTVRAQQGSCFKAPERNMVLVAKVAIDMTEDQTAVSRAI